MSHNKWFYIDSQGKELFQKRFDEASPFQIVEGNLSLVARVRNGDLWGIIDAGGEWLVKPQYSSLYTYHAGLARAEDPQSGLFGYINLQGKEVIPCQFEDADSFEHGYAVIRMYSNDIWMNAAIDSCGKVIIAYTSNTLEILSEKSWCLMRQGKRYLYDFKGRPVLKKGYDFINELEPGLYIVRDDNQEFLLDQSENILSPLCDLIHPFDSNLLAIAERSEDTTDSTRMIYTLIDKQGRQLSPWCDRITAWTNELYRLSQDTDSDTAQEWLIDSTGRAVSEKYSGIDNMSEGIARVYDLKSFNYGYIDLRGRPLTPMVYTEADYFSEGKAAVRIVNEAYYIDTNGQALFGKVFRHTESFSEDRAQIYVKPGQSTYIDQYGELITQTFYYDTHYFKHGRGRVEKDGKTAFVDKQGNIISDWYDEAGDFHETAPDNKKYMALVRKGTKYGFIDYDGHLKIPCVYDLAFDYSFGVSLVKGDINDESSWGYIDDNGKTLLPLKYRNLDRFESYIKSVRIEYDKLILINNKGEKISE